MSFVSLREIVKIYYFAREEHCILNKVNLEIEKGDFVAIKGASGSGKSSLLKIMGLLDVVSSGSLEIKHTRCDSLSEYEAALFRRRNISFIFQAFNLLPDFTALENVLISHRIDSVNSKNFFNQANLLFNKLELGNRMNYYPSQLSGGEQQRVAIIRALLKSPSLLLADEPTGNLDDKNTEKVFSLLKENVVEKNITTIVVTHDNRIAKSADKVYLLSGGKLNREC